MDWKISENFLLSETRCRGTTCACHGAWKFDPELLKILQHFRTLLAEPVSVTSWFRCDVHNTEVGGWDKSEHRMGMAVDVTSSKIRAQMQQAAELAGQIVQGICPSKGNVLYYPKRGFIHIDVGETWGDGRVKEMQSDPKPRGW